MAWGAFSFSREGRARLAAVLRALLIVQLVISLLVVLLCYNASFRVMSLLKQVHRLTVYLFYGLIVVHAYCMKLQYTSGLRLISWLLKCPHWPRAALAARTWLISGTLVAFNGLLVYAACRGTLKALMKELSSSLRIGIAQYLTEPTWKHLMDTMQIELSCCGVERPNDWHEIPWINLDFLNEESLVVMKLAGTDGKILPPVSPYSCCTPRVLAACYHDPLQQVNTTDIVEWRGAWATGSPLPSASLHTRGCAEAIRAPLARALLGLQVFNVLVLLLQFIIVILAQLLRTSAIEAVLSGDFDGLGRGWLLGTLGPTERASLITKAEAYVSARAEISYRRVPRTYARYS
ncbi:PREDICTED: RDS/peripherin-like protein xRDS35 [Papilio xuthus]|uniref:RDS/peripherin-like protein xRDS35 n=1 Tax=Papilio xuthus TaxID=66420 RepID=A0AAJ6ZMI7_PAPXU|nr:PREDICTED: RDS/peripherin-like protein xRDS35 [Papilio xuthus]XP_013175758.1 PREDICTED: RDS/peripherin-like protein xRDS35 [Papilio xuthus]